MAFDRLKPLAETALSTFDAGLYKTDPLGRDARMGDSFRHTGLRPPRLGTEFERSGEVIDSNSLESHESAVDYLPNHGSVIDRFGLNTIEFRSPEYIEIDLITPDVDASNGLEKPHELMCRAVGTPGVQEASEKASYPTRHRILCGFIGQAAVAAWISFMVGVGGTIQANLPAFLYF